MTISRRSSDAVCGSLRMPKSSMMSSGTVVMDSMYCLRVRRERNRRVFQQDVSFTVQHAIALLNGRLADDLCQMTLARTARANEHRIFVARDKGAGCGGNRRT